MSEGQFTANQNRKESNQNALNSGNSFSRNLSSFRDAIFENTTTETETKYLSAESTRAFWNRFNELMAKQSPDTLFTFENFNKILLDLRRDKTQINLLRKESVVVNQ